jgi:hypothetical protein
VALFWVTQRTRPRFSPNTRIGTITPSDEAYDSGEKSRSVIPENPEESFPSFTPDNDTREEQKVQLNVRLTRESDISTAPRPSLARWHSRSRARGGARSPWSMESAVSSFSRKSQEQRDGDRQLGVSFCDPLPALANI